MPFEKAATRGFPWRASAEMANSFASGLAAEARVRAEEEYRRLLYVGMTRAEGRRIVCGYHGRKQPERGWHAMVRDALALSPATREIAHPVTGEPMLRYQVTPPGRGPQTQQKTEAAPPPPKPLPALLAEPLPAPPRLPRPL